MTIKQLRYVIEIVQQGSINEAAKKLYITQPSLSSTLKDLEKELGISIFHRTAKGITLTTDGAEFLSYARQVNEQMELLEQRYQDKEPSKKLCSISTQHYAFAVNAFVNLIEESPASEYDYTLRETRTSEIIDDVLHFRSEIGILYLNPFNEKVLMKLLHENHLDFHHLFTAKPHIFISKNNPLSQKASVTLDQLEEFPYLSFEQGEFNSFYFSEEILSTTSHKKNIHVSDRATLFNLLIGLNGYTISTGIVSSDLNGDQIVSIPLDVDDSMHVGWISNPKASQSQEAKRYILALKKVLREANLKITE